MACNLDRILVVDIEATCWDDTPPEGEVSEIIEIGVTPLHVPSGELGQSVSYLIRPERSRVSDFCTRLTTITQRQLDKQGITFKEACRRIEEKLGGRSRAMASWGNDDRTLVLQQCTEGEVRYPFGDTHLNVASLYAMQRGLKTSSSLLKALGNLGLTFEGTHHRGVDDARNTAKILAHVLGFKTAAEAGAQHPFAQLAQFDPEALAQYRAEHLGSLELAFQP